MEKRSSLDSEMARLAKDMRAEFAAFRIEMRNGFERLRRDEVIVQIVWMIGIMITAFATGLITMKLFVPS